MTTDQAESQPRGWPIFLLGMAVFFLGPVTYAIQFGALKQTTMPWLMLALTSVAVAMMACSLWLRFGVTRLLGLLLFAGITGLQWFFFMVVARTPDYTGPAQIDNVAPEFKVALASGSSFANRDFKESDATVLLFFRGRW